MSSLVINWRFWGLFVQVDHWAAWRSWLRGELIGGRPWRFSWVRGRPSRDEPWIEFYQGRAYFLTLVFVALMAVLLLWD